jgi:hypothetical protein
MEPISFLEYATQRGDTFDRIALAVYDDEFMAGEIMKHNPAYMSTLIFEAGHVLYVPLFAEEPASRTQPPWVR